jgi:hypothetical protein
MAAGGEAEDVGGEGFRAAHDALLADPSLQFKLEAVQPPEPAQTPDWLKPLIDFIEFISPALTYIFWGGVALIAALILYAVVKEILARQWSLTPKTKQAPVVAEPPQFRPSVERARVLLEEADRLAREGRFGEAVRVILHHSIEDMELALAMIIPLSMTSREITGLSQLSEQGRAVFGKIARAVELSFFGQRPLNQDQYLDCRRDYEAFVFGGAPA